MSAAQSQAHYWPEGEEPPRLPDGTIDVRALCRRWDDQANDLADLNVSDVDPLGAVRAAGIPVPDPAQAARPDLCDCDPQGSHHCMDRDPEAHRRALAEVENEPDPWSDPEAAG